MSQPPVFKNTLEPLVPLITETFGLHRSHAYRNATVFEDHVMRVLGRRLPRSGKARQLMVDRELWTVFERCFAAYHDGSQPSFHAALANGYSGEYPEARSLEDVHQSVAHQREALTQLRVWLTEQVERQDQELSELRRGLGELRDFLQTEFAQVTPLSQEVAAQRETGETQHRELVALLGTHGEQLDHLTEGMRVVAEVVSAMADQFQEPAPV
ncbi:hypothetical protein ACFFLM_03290 [Deinococcus oregonensis]|uniref:Uncharacterized protein n=1 Tax=Deinococcus oregonensis TaxID=1805970 RepID=A0ABV6AU17_9DEIO